MDPKAQLNGLVTIFASDFLEQCKLQTTSDTAKKYVVIKNIVSDNKLTESWGGSAHHTRYDQ